MADIIILDLVTVDGDGVTVYTPFPAPTDIAVGDEIIWSSDTGRAQNAEMLGTVIATKKDIKVAWGILTAAQKLQIETGLGAGFVKVRLRDGGRALILTVYRGTITSDYMGYLSDGKEYYRSASVSLIQK